jgi:hypothetical protein
MFRTVRFVGRSFCRLVAALVKPVTLPPWCHSARILKERKATTRLTVNEAELFGHSVDMFGGTLTLLYVLRLTSCRVFPNVMLVVGTAFATGASFPGFPCRRTGVRGGFLNFRVGFAADKDSRTGEI